MTPPQFQATLKSYPSSEPSRAISTDAIDFGLAEIQRAQRSNEFGIVRRLIVTEHVNPC